MSVNTFLFVGKPGSGKGTQSELLSNALGYPVFSTGDKVRQISKQDSALGKKVKSVSESGGLTPHWFASFLFQEAVFSKREGEGMIFEGTGRSEEEARLFIEIHEWLGTDFIFFNLNVSDETVMQRLVKRGELEGRADDVPEKIKHRLENYYQTTLPAIEYIRSTGKLIEIDGERTPEEVNAEVLSYIKND